MEKYFLFAGSTYYPLGGAYDLKGEYDSIQDAKAFDDDEDYSWAHITDASGSIVWERDN